MLILGTLKTTVTFFIDTWPVCLEIKMSVAAIKEPLQNI